MKRSLVSLVITLSFIFALFAGCSGEDDGRIHMPSSSRNYEGAHYQTVMDELTSAGFSNITTEVLEDLITGWTTDDGEVEKVTVDGSITTFSTDSKYDPDVSIVITYHTFPSKVEPEEASSTPTAPSTDEGIEPMDILTTGNCEDFAELLRSSDYAHYSDFAGTYKNRTVEFDGWITSLVNHDDYDTRYDVLLSGGDYVNDETANPGPTFKFQDVNTSDMGIDDLFLPSFVATGNNVHIIAEIVEFNADTGIFYLNPVSISER